MAEFKLTRIEWGVMTPVPLAKPPLNGDMMILVEDLSVDFLQFDRVILEASRGIGEVVLVFAPNGPLDDAPVELLKRVFLKDFECDSIVAWRELTFNIENHGRNLKWREITGLGFPVFDIEMAAVAMSIVAYRGTLDDRRHFKVLLGDERFRVENEYLNEVHHFRVEADSD